jgi:hypothetical protein
MHEQGPGNPQDKEAQDDWACTGMASLGPFVGDTFRANTADSALAC